MATIKEIYEQVLSEIKPMGGADIKDIPLVSDLGLAVITKIATQFAEQNNQVVINKGSVLRQTTIKNNTGDISL